MYYEPHEMKTANTSVAGYSKIWQLTGMSWPCTKYDGVSYCNVWAYHFSEVESRMVNYITSIGTSRNEVVSSYIKENYPTNGEMNGVWYKAID